MEQKESKINGLIQSTMEKLGDLANVDTVIGKPIITASGIQIIPFSKVSMGDLSGGGEYGDVKVVKESNEFPFAGVSGAVVSVKPMGFIVDDGKNCRIMRITGDPMDNLIERASDILRDLTAKNP